MNKERLLKLASELERCSRGRVLTLPGDGKADFDMGVVAMGEIRGEERTGTPCGSACCAMGFAGLHPWFRKRGLKWVPDSSHLTITPFKINGKDAGDFSDAGAKFFRISLAQSMSLFLSARPRETPKHMAKRIRKFVADHA